MATVRPIICVINNADTIVLLTDILQAVAATSIQSENLSNSTDNFWGLRAETNYTESGGEKITNYFPTAYIPVIWND